MLYKAKTLVNYALQSLEGDFREIAQFYVYVVVEVSGGPFFDRKVLVASSALLGVNESQGRLFANLTRSQIESCPESKDCPPVSRQREPAFHDYYDPKTKAQDNADMFPYIPGPDLDADRGKPRPIDRVEDGWDRHLRSTHALTEYDVESTDGDVGHIDDFIIDDTTWGIRYLVVSAHRWWPGRKALVSTQWVTRISADDSKVSVNLSQEAVKESPVYDERTSVTREYETAVSALRSKGILDRPEHHHEPP
jgi:hypothetical protein